MNERLQTTSCFREIIFQQLCLQEATDLVPFINRLIDLFRTCADRINATVTTFDSQRSSLPKQRTIRRQTNCFLAPFLPRRQRRKTIETKKKRGKKEEERNQAKEHRESWKITFLHLDREVSPFDSNLFAIFPATWTRLESSWKKVSNRGEARYRINWQFLIHRLTSFSLPLTRNRTTLPAERGRYEVSPVWLGLRRPPTFYFARLDRLGRIANRPSNRAVIRHSFSGRCSFSSR